MAEVDKYFPEAREGRFRDEREGTLAEVREEDVRGHMVVGGGVAEGPLGMVV